ncbi:MAG TPA: MATE family efflux transporter [Limnochordia bacterium]
MDGLAFAAETMIGNDLGRGDRARARASGRAVLQWAFGFGAFLAVTYWLGEGALSRLFSAEPAVQEAVRETMWLVALGQIPAALAYAFDGILIGATDSRYLRNAMAISAAGFFAVAWLTWSVGGPSLTAVWGSQGAFAALRALTLYLRYRSGAWSYIARPLREGTG